MKERNNFHSKCRKIWKLDIANCSLPFLIFVDPTFSQQGAGHLSLLTYIHTYMPFLYKQKSVKRGGAFQTITYSMRDTHAHLSSTYN